MRKHVTLITGAGGEIGHGLIERLAEEGDTAIITIDLNPLEGEFAVDVFGTEFELVETAGGAEAAYTGLKGSRQRRTRFPSTSAI